MATGSRAARIAGNKPPSTPMRQAQTIPKIINCGLTVSSNTIWPMPPHDVDRATIFFQGLSGETYEVPDPQTGETHLLRRTLMLEYQTPGSIEKQPRKPWLFRDESWIVR